MGCDGARQHGHPHHSLIHLHRCASTVNGTRLAKRSSSVICTIARLVPRWLLACGTQPGAPKAAGHRAYLTANQLGPRNASC